MLTHEDLSSLVRQETVSGSHVLSIYLDVDQSRMANLNREFETALRAMLRSIKLQIIRDQEREEFVTKSARIQHYVSDYKPAGRSLVLFSHHLDHSLWTRELNVSMENLVRWDESPYVRPLLEAMEQHKRFGVVLADRTQGRILTFFLGELETHFEALASARVKHFRESGSDHIRSQMHFQRKADLHVFWHLKHVAEMTDRLEESHPFDRLILAGPSEVTHILYRLLSKRLQARVAASIPLPISSNVQQVLEAARKVEQEHERLQELEEVDHLLVSSAKQKGTVTGLKPTLEALYEGRVWKLIYSDKFLPHGRQCSTCKKLYVDEKVFCADCYAFLQPLDDLVEHALERVIKSGGQTEQVQGEASRRLAAAGGIGAILRF